MRLDDILLPYQKNFCNSTSSRKIFLKARQIGGSFCIAYCCIKKAAINPNTLSLILSTGERAAQELLKKVQQWAEALRIASNGAITWTSNACEVRLSNGSRICSIPSGNTQAARGYTVTGILAIDEAGYIQNFDELWQSVIPTMTNRMRQIQPELILASTPSAKNSLFGKIWFSNDDFEHFSTTIQQAQADGLKCDIDELHKLVPDPKQFAVEFECEWNDSENALIDTSLLQYGEVKPKYKNYYMGVDWARTNDSTSIAIIGDDDGKAMLVDVLTMNNIDYDTQVAHVKRLWKQYDCKAGYGDAGGLGSPLCEELNKHMSAKFKGLQFTATNKPQMYENFKKRIFDRTLSFSAEFKQLLNDEISLVRQFISKDGKASYQAVRQNHSHADSLTAIILALQAIHDNPVSFAMPASYSRQSVFSGYSRLF